MEIAENNAPKIWDRTAVVELLNRSDKAVAKALWTIYQRQTSTEQNSKKTIERNNRGFNSHEARFLSDVANRLPRYDFNLTRRQLSKVRPMILKYWRQLLEEIEAKGGIVDYAKSPKDDFANSFNDEPAISQHTDIAASPISEVVAPPDRPANYGMFG